MTKFLVGGDRVPARKSADRHGMNALFLSLFEISRNEILVDYGKKKRNW
ncbi:MULTISPECIES: hypothetical protein [Sphingobacterium]|nr:MULTISPECIES: hypothetical protein [Sphingobacterium]